uniref:Uncharacterized protein n=1 Tax=Knipowitschia caucasica TaxID=637954 RepID=A0AAV2L3H9_KNICA
MVDFSWSGAAWRGGGALRRRAVRGRGQAEVRKLSYRLRPISRPSASSAMNPVLAALSHDAILTPVQCSAPLAKPRPPTPRCAVQEKSY